MLARKWNCTWHGPVEQLSLHGPGQVQFHFRAGTGGGGIKVYDRPSQGKQVATITSRNEARDFVKTGSRS